MIFLMIKITIYGFIILWGALALVAYKNAKISFSTYRKIVQIDP